MDEYTAEARLQILIEFGAYYDGELYAILEDFLERDEKGVRFTEYEIMRYKLACTILDERERSAVHWSEPDYDQDDWS